MSDIVIVADDLSGAADCAIACVAGGMETMVLLDAAAEFGVGAVAVDTNARAMTPGNAAAAAAGAAARLAGPSTRILYHKIDSTLRGHWAMETAGILEAATGFLGDAPLAIVAPAFPAAGRTVEAGCVLIGGEPLERTQLWRHAGLVGPAHIPTRLAEAGLAVATAGLDQVAQGVPALAAWFQERAAGHSAIVCDARTDEDLRTIAAASLMLARKPLWVGSAGLMRALVPTERTPPPVGWVAEPRVTMPILTLVGSASAVSQEQFARLAGEPGVAALTVPAAVLRPGVESKNAELCRDAVANAVASGRDIAVRIDAGPEVDLREGPQLAAALAEIIVPHLRRIGALVVTGGETARAVLVRAGVTGLQMRGEVEPGIPLGRSTGALSIPVITKAGAFGNPATLIRCRAALRER